jgi:hypothetical protein
MAQMQACQEQMQLMAQVVEEEEHQESSLHFLLLDKVVVPEDQATLT